MENGNERPPETDAIAEAVDRALHPAPSPELITPIIEPVSTESEPPAAIATGRLFWDNKPLVAAAVVYGINLCTLLVAYMTSSYDIANMATAIPNLCLILCPILVGIGTVKLTMQSVNQHGGQINPKIMIGLILMAASVVGALFTFIPGIILLLLGFRDSSGWNRPIGKNGKTALAVAAFIGSGLAGLIVAFLIYFLTSSRVCQLSSSKCY